MSFRKLPYPLGYIECGGNKAVSLNVFEPEHIDLRHTIPAVRPRQKGTAVILLVYGRR